MNNSLSQIAIQIPEGLQRLKLHLYACGLIGWTAETGTNESDSSEAAPATDQNEAASQAQLNFMRAFDALRVGAPATITDNDDSFSDWEAYADAQAYGDAQSDDGSTSESVQRSQVGMSDEDQIATVQAFIVGDDTLNSTLQDAAWMAATQLVSSLADTSEYFEPEVIDTMLDVHVHLHTVEGGLQLKIGHGITARSIYIYGDEGASDNEDNVGDHIVNDSTYHDDDEHGVQAGSGGRAVVSGSVASEEGVACPVCLSTYNSNIRMAALGCHHHVCNSCFRRLPRPKVCPICRAHISSHVEVIL